MSEIELDSNSARGLRAALRDLRESAAAFRTE